MAPRFEYGDTPDVVDDGEADVGGVDAEAEDEAAVTGSEQQQAANELKDLDTDNIIDDDSDGPTTRGNKGDPLAADKQVDQAIDDAEDALESQGK
ncbi:unnamed protein product [Parajaminaea phylloscopi]